MTVHVHGRCKVRRIAINNDQHATTTLSFTCTPLDGSVLPPDLRGSTTIEHDEPILVSLQVWKAVRDEADVSAGDVMRQHSNGDDDRCLGRWNALLTKEAATRKQADSKGGEVVEYRVSLSFDFPSDAPFRETLAGRLAGSRALFAAIVRRQQEIDIPRRKRAADEPGLPFGGTEIDPASIA